MLKCHCRDCQRSSGGAYQTYVVFPADGLTISGELSHDKATGDAGFWVERSFCPRCGNPIAARLERAPDIIAVTAASLDEPAAFAPSMDLFCSSACDCDVMSPATRKFERGFME
jgi:hypothetical protein